MQRASWVKFGMALAALALMAFAPVQADVVAVVNATRNACGTMVLPPLQANAKLSRATQLLASGGSPHDAARDAGYQATELAALHFTGYNDETQLRQILRKRYCRQLGDARFADVGVAQRGDDTWILLGAQLSTPHDSRAASERVLQLVNDARARARNCGSQSFAAAAPLALNATLAKAAREHTADMAHYSYMDHQGRDGSTPAQRVTRAGYKWSRVGENVAAGAGTAEDVVAGWLSSPGHCANIMNPTFTEMGVAFALANDDYGIYWTQVFAAPRK